MITMKPKGAGVPYKHPNVRYQNPTQQVDFGGYVTFYSIKKSEDLDLRIVPLPVNIIFDGSPMRAYFEKLIKAKVLNSTMQTAFNRSQLMELPRFSIKFYTPPSYSFFRQYTRGQTTKAITDKGSGWFGRKSAPELAMILYLRLLSGYTSAFYSEAEMARNEIFFDYEGGVTAEIMYVGGVTPHEQYQLHEYLVGTSNRWKYDFKTGILKEAPKNDLTGARDQGKISQTSFIKSFDKVSYPNPDIIQKGKFSFMVETTDALNKWLQNNRDEVVHERKHPPVKTGYTILNNDKNASKQFEFHSGSVRNKSYALYHRHLGAQTRIRDYDLGRFDAM